MNDGPSCSVDHIADWYENLNRWTGSRRSSKTAWFGYTRSIQASVLMNQNYLNEVCSCEVRVYIVFWLLRHSFLYSAAIDQSSVFIPTKTARNSVRKAAGCSTPNDNNDGSDVTDVDYHELYSFSSFQNCIGNVLICTEFI